MQDYHIEDIKGMNNMKSIVITDIKYEEVDPNSEYVRITHKNGLNRISPVDNNLDVDFLLSKEYNIENVQMFQYRLGNEMISIGMSDDVKDILSIPLETYDELYSKISKLEKLNETIWLKNKKHVENEKELHLSLHQFKLDLDKEVNRGLFSFIKQKIKRYFNI